MRCINKWKRVLVAAGLVTILLGSTACSVLKKDSASYQLYQTSSDYGLASDVISPVNMLKTTHLAVKNPKKSSKFNISNVKSAAVIDVSARKIKYEYQLFQKVYPASTTKLLTAYIALKYGNLSDRITVSTSAAAVPTGSSVAGLKAGDQITLEDALYGLILRSGNDCANVIAEHISGNISKFALLMNQEAKSMGATKTHFVNPHGFPDTNHYTLPMICTVFFLLHYKISNLINSYQQRNDPYPIKMHPEKQYMLHGRVQTGILTVRQELRKE